MAAEGTSTNFQNLQNEQPAKKKTWNLNQHQRKKRREAKMANISNEPQPSIDPQVALSTKKKRKRYGPNLNKQQRIRKWKNKMSINANGPPPSVDPQVSLVSAKCEEVEEAAEEVMEVAATTANEEFLKGLFFENF